MKPTLGDKRFLTFVASYFSFFYLFSRSRSTLTFSTPFQHFLYSSPLNKDVHSSQSSHCRPDGFNFCCLCSSSPCFGECSSACWPLPLLSPLFFQPQRILRPLKTGLPTHLLRLTTGWMPISVIFKVALSTT